MKIIADENIPCVTEMFQHIGDVTTMPGRDIGPDNVMDADVLLVRSVTKVDGKLLSGSQVRFVGTATIGTDHIDTDYLKGSGVAFASAPGSNANSVAEYITAALLVLACRRDESLEGRSIGVVGVGNVGSRVVEKAEALGMNVIKNDPPLARTTADSSFKPLEDALKCDYVTMHVPLKKSGTDPTYHMVDANFLNTMCPHAVLLNSSRGKVVDQQALKKSLKNNSLGGAVLDVWENEPDIDTGVLELADIATPHIAGYSLDGKYAGVGMLYEALCDFLECEHLVDIEKLKPEPEVKKVVAPKAENTDKILNETVRQVYDIEEDDRKLRGVICKDKPARADYFDNLRKNYKVRREFYTALAGRSDALSPALWEQIRPVLENIGFNPE